MEDYHQALKLAATLPVIETYQDKNMPKHKACAETIRRGKKAEQQNTGFG
jgi:hypothetical protein